MSNTRLVRPVENHKEEIKETLINMLSDAKIVSAELKDELAETYIGCSPFDSRVASLPGISEVKIRFIRGASKREEALSEEVIKSDRRTIEKVLDFKTKNSKRGHK